MDKQQQPMQGVADPNLYYVTNVAVNEGEEEFVINIFSGAQVRQFAASPAHAKRIWLLLDQKIKDFESKKGVIETKLPDITPIEGESQTSVGFQPPVGDA